MCNIYLFGFSYIQYHLTYILKTNTMKKENMIWLFNVLFHEFSVEIGAQSVIYKLLVFVVNVALCTVFEHHIIIPSGNKLFLKKNWLLLHAYIVLYLKPTVSWLWNLQLSPGGSVDFLWWCFPFLFSRLLPSSLVAIKSK